MNQFSPFYDHIFFSFLRPFINIVNVCLVGSLCFALPVFLFFSALQGYGSDDVGMDTAVEDTASCK